MIAVQHGDLELVSILKHTEFGIKDNNQLSAFMHAVKIGSLQCMEELTNEVITPEDGRQAVDLAL